MTTINKTWEDVLDCYQASVNVLAHLKDRVVSTQKEREKEDYGKEFTPGQKLDADKEFEQDQLDAEVLEKVTEVLKKKLRKGYYRKENEIRTLTALTKGGVDSTGRSKGALLRDDKGNLQHDAEGLIKCTAEIDDLKEQEVEIPVVETDHKIDLYEFSWLKDFVVVTTKVAE